MDENEKKEPETAQEPPKPENYSQIGRAHV